MSGRLIVLEGLDGSGKATQTLLLTEALENQGKPVRRVEYPNYDSPSSALVKMYLAGEFGSDPDAVNPYAAGSFYAVDRFAGYVRDWREDYLAGSWILADRYTTANAIYQMEKLPREEWNAYLSWMEDFEYGKLGLPKPDRVLFLDVPVELSQALLSQRYRGDEKKKDIHERRPDYLRRCAECAAYAGQQLGWERIDCAQDGALLPVGEIHRRVLAALEEKNP